MNCAYCNSTDTEVRGRRDSERIYKCNSCNRIFCEYDLKYGRIDKELEGGN